MRTRWSRTERNVIHLWLWWATFEIAMQCGSKPLAAYRAAQKATARLYAGEDR